MKTKLKKNIARVFLILSFFALINSIPSLVEASKTQKSNDHNDNIINTIDNQKHD